MHKQVDILIVGGGLVGSSLAIALNRAGIHALMVEARRPPATTQPLQNERNLALARASINGLQHLGVWTHAASHATPITRIDISRKGDFGSARLDAARFGIDAFGCTLPASKLGQALATELDACTQVERVVPATVEQLAATASGWQVQLATADGAMTVHTRLLVGADGSHSFVRRALAIDASRHDYQQTLFVASVMPEKSLQGQAFERFTDHGPVALLPLQGERAGLVLTVSQAEADTVAELSDADFLHLAQQRFGWRVGHLSRLGRRYRHPIERVAAASISARRAVLVGNAAQTIHPIGAQGFNLGLRDALTLAEMLQDASDPGAAALLDAYVCRRQSDRSGVMHMSHGLVSLACLPAACLSPLRTLGLLAFDRLPPLRRAMIRRGMGFRGQSPQAVLEPLA